jgi:hypothetical protein
MHSLFQIVDGGKLDRPERLADDFSTGAFDYFYNLTSFSGGSPDGWVARSMWSRNQCARSDCKPNR